ncbi:hypothetical protein RSOLAG1IB_03990 [Rhizoctonia solani AG-1 IB]|uniref:Uncharacterized protein n=1 Tax=Thanatephorus cucumeris (strain AG1-IB / isolate 7/3/14) TaxID=1108050 RepID=A0A0B7FRZ5_THACB|nr:hypothetical protein RSOLAG1IB_03990 [Rhizoctonia solani AG-1 IB]
MESGGPELVPQHQQTVSFLRGPVARESDYVGRTHSAYFPIFAFPSGYVMLLMSDNLRHTAALFSQIGAKSPIDHLSLQQSACSNDLQYVSRDAWRSSAIDLS